MGFKKNRNRAIKEAEEEKKEEVKKFLEEIDGVCKRHKLVLVPMIGKYGATFEVQNIKEPEIKVDEEEKKES